MSVPPATRRKTSNTGLTDKTPSDKNKQVSGHTGTKDGTHGETVTQKRKSTFKKSNSVEQTSVRVKSDNIKHSSADTRTKTTHTARGTHANESPKSHRTRPTHSSHSPAKAQTHTDTSGKTVTHGKTGAHGTTKKSGTSKSPAKNNKTEQVKSDSKKNNHIEPDNTVSTAVSQQH